MTGGIGILGILNLTPDSFFAASRSAAGEVLSRAARLFEEGADAVDLGACSTRPGAPQPSLEEEWARLEPALKAWRGYSQGETFPEIFARTGSRSDISGKVSPWPALSIDTYRAEIVRRAYETVGPFLVNDISGGQLDPSMLETVGALGLPYVAMHMRGTPETMQQFTDYPEGIVAAVKAYFQDFAVRARAAGIRQWLLDPGFGFSKTLQQNYELLNGLSELHHIFEQPILAGLSRKSMVYKALGISPEEAMPATQVVQFAALERGARWLRVHDVAAAVQTARLYSTMYTSSPGAAK
jgi:dihydropteroate synthase